MTRPGNGPYAGPSSDGMIHFTVTLDEKTHDEMIKALLKGKASSRTGWIQNAVREKLEREKARD